MLCTNKFFDSKVLPEIDLTDEQLLLLANENVNKGLTIPGVQKKLSLHLSKNKNARLTLIGYPAGYILKPASSEYEHLPEIEDMVMDIAEMMGVKTVPHGLIPLKDTYAYITKRIDRIENRKNEISLLAMEDFCQLGERLTEDKYKSSYEKCAAIIQKYSVHPGLDMSEFFLRLLVSFITGNSDMHLKNFSLIETAPGNRQFILSQAYDLLPTNLLLPEDTDEMALTLCGKRSRFKKDNFLSFAESCHIPAPAAKAMINHCIHSFDKAKEICLQSYISEKQKEDFLRLMEERINRLI